MWCSFTARSATRAKHRHAPPPPFLLASSPCSPFSSPFLLVSPFAVVDACVVSFVRFFSFQFRRLLGLGVLKLTVTVRKETDKGKRGSRAEQIRPHTIQTIQTTKQKRTTRSHTHTQQHTHTYTHYSNSESTLTHLYRCASGCAAVPPGRFSSSCFLSSFLLPSPPLSLSA